MDGCFILCLILLLKSYSEYLNPCSCFANLFSNFASSWLCSFASNEASFTHPTDSLNGLRSILIPGIQPNGPKFRNPNFLPPLLCNSCPNCKHLMSNLEYTPLLCIKELLYIYMLTFIAVVKLPRTIFTRRELEYVDVKLVELVIKYGLA